MFALNNFKFQHSVLIICVFILKFHYYDFNSHVNQKFYANASGINLLRFRNFEPRNIIRTTDADIKPIMFDRLVRNIRKPRGFQFHADDRDFNVDLEFIIPFVRIPIERSTSVTQTAFRSLFNLNLNSLLTTGTIVVIGGIFAIILKTIFLPFAYASEYKKISRKEESFLYNHYESENNTQNVNQLITIIESKLQQNNINISQCIQKSLCNYAQEKLVNQKSADGGLIQILDGVLSLRIVRDYMNGTAIQNALDAANNKDNCNAIYKQCNWLYPKNNLFKLLTKYLNMT